MSRALEAAESSMAWMQVSPTAAPVAHFKRQEEEDEGGDNNNNDEDNNNNNNDEDNNNNDENEDQENSSSSESSSSDQEESSSSEDSSSSSSSEEEPSSSEDSSSQDSSSLESSASELSSDSTESNSDSTISESASASASSDSDGGGGGINKGVVAGSVIGSVVGLLFLLALFSRIKYRTDRALLGRKLRKSGIDPNDAAAVAAATGGGAAGVAGSGLMMKERKSGEEQENDAERGFAQGRYQNVNQSDADDLQPPVPPGFARLDSHAANSASRGSLVSPHDGNSSDDHHAPLPSASPPLPPGASPFFSAGAQGDTNSGEGNSASENSSPIMMAAPGADSRSPSRDRQSSVTGRESSVPRSPYESLQRHLSGIVLDEDEEQLDGSNRPNASPSLVFNNPYAPGTPKDEREDIEMGWDYSKRHSRMSLAMGNQSRASSLGRYGPQQPFGSAL